LLAVLYDCAADVQRVGLSLDKLLCIFGKQVYVLAEITVIDD